MVIGFYKGAMYARLENDEILDKSPITLGDGTLEVGDCVNKLGDKSRTAFEMQEEHLRAERGKRQSKRHNTCKGNDGTYYRLPALP